jgi:hypothetical protein
MKISIKPDGEILMDTNGSTPAEVAGTILSIQRELREQAKAEAAQADRERTAPVELGTIMSELWEWLVDNDTEKGVHIQAVANHFHISKENASQRCQRLMSEGHATRVAQARYRATTGA